MYRQIESKRVIITILISVVLPLSVLATLTLFPGTSYADESTPDYSRFTDVPEDHWAFKAIHDLRLLKITDGIGNNQFGLGKQLKEANL